MILVHLALFVFKNDMQNLLFPQSVASGKLHFFLLLVAAFYRRQLWTVLAYARN